jgi:hypothetical protein
MLLVLLLLKIISFNPVILQLTYGSSIMLAKVLRVFFWHPTLTTSFLLVDVIQSVTMLTKLLCFIF